MKIVIEDRGEFIGNLKVELLVLREDLRVRAITPEQARKRVEAIRARRMTALARQPRLFGRGPVSPAVEVVSA